LTVPPLDRQKRAERLYEDAWVTGISPAAMMAMMDRTGNDSAMRCVEKALELSPGNSIYEQALVWFCPPSSLRAFMEKRDLGSKARRLAAGLIFQYEDSRSTMPGRHASGMPLPGIGAVKGSGISDAATLTDRLRRIDELQKADPDNAFVRYKRAIAYEQAGRVNDMCAEVHKANLLPGIREYVPEVPRSAADSMIVASASDADFAEMASFRQLARDLADSGTAKLRDGDVSAARTILEDCCRMGVKVASAEPHGFIHFSVGDAVFSIGWFKLNPLYKDFRPQAERDKFRRLYESFNRGQKKLMYHAADNLHSDFFNIRLGIVAIPIAFTAMGFASIVCLMLVLLFWWLPSVLIRRRRHTEAPALLPWGEGFLARLNLLLFVPIVPAAISFMHIPFVSFAVPLIALVGVPVLAVLVIIVRILRRCYIRHADAGVGVWRFIFRSPAEIRAWTAKYLLAALLAYTIGLICCLLVAASVYKISVGNVQWDLARRLVLPTTRDQIVVGKAIADLQGAYPND
jgi:hypothetical protein